MRYVDILCVGGPLDGNRKTTDEDCFDVMNSGPPTWHLNGSATFNQPTVLKARYELVALDMKHISVMFFKPTDLPIEEALTKIINGYNPRARRY